MSALSKASPVLVATFGAASLLASLALPPGRGGRAAADCSPVTVGIDTTSWNDSYGTALGQAIGQTFLARDTLISRLTLWRPPRNATIWGNHLFITEVDSTLRPDTGHILQDGPSVAVRSDGVHLTRMDFVLDPPLALPRPGHYAFFIQRDFCDDGETDLIATTSTRMDGSGQLIAPVVERRAICLRPPARLDIAISYFGSNSAGTLQRAYVKRPGGG